MISLNPNW